MWDKGKRLLRGAAVAAFWLAIWQLISKAVNAELLFPSPLAVLKAWAALCTSAAFWNATALSLLRVLGGFFAAVIVGSLLAVITVRSSGVRLFFAPLLHVVRAAPVASFSILALVWIREGALPLFISFLMVVPIVWDMMEQGIRQTDPQLLEMAKLYRFSPMQTFWRVRFPSVLPYLLASMTTGMGFAWKSAVAAEIISAPYPADSIGAYLRDAKTYLESPAVFAWTATAIVLSMGLSALMRRITRPLLRRYGNV